MVTQLRAHGQWEVVDGSVVAPTYADPANPTPEEVRDLNAWNLRAARAYAEIALRLDEEYGETIAAISDPHQAWMMLESSYGSQQSGIQGNINAELTLARWDGQTPVTAHRDHMNALRTRLAGTGLIISPVQFYNHFTNLLPAEYDTVVAMHDPIPSNYSINALCERFRAIELRKELRTTKGTSTPEDLVALLAKQKGSKGGKAEGSHGKGKGDASGGKAKKPKGTCWGCGKKGHYERDCRSKKTEKGGQSSGGSNANAAASGSGGKNASSDKPAPSKPAGGTLLCLMEPCETAYRTTSIKDAAQYYVDSGTTGHYTNERDALHDYVPFEVNRAITTANGTTPAFGLGTLKFTTVVDGKQTKGELKDVYYLPDIRTRLISYGELYSQGWEPHIGRNGFTLRDQKGNLVIKVPMSNNTFTVTLRTTYPDHGLLAREDSEVSDDLLHERLALKCEYPDTAFSTGENKEPVSLFNWHRRMGHRSLKTIVDMAKGAVTGMVLKDVPKDIPSMDICPSCALTKSRHFPYKDGRTRATEPLELIHGDLVGPMPVESVSKYKYGFVLMDDYSQASWVLLLGAKSDAPIEFEKWVRTVMFDNAKEFVAGRMKELCDERGIRIISSVPYSPSSNGIAERLVGVATNGTRAMLRDSGLPPRFWAEAMSTFMYLRNRTPTATNEGRTPYERFYKMKPDVEHIRTFGCVVKVVLPSQTLGKLDDRAVMGYLLGYKYEGGYRVWIPKLGVRETRDVVFYEGEAPMTPVDGGTIESRREEVQVTSGRQPTLAPPPPPPVATSAPSHDTEVDHEKNGVLDSPDIETSSERLTIRLPGRYHPRAPQPQQHPEPVSPQGDSEEPPASLRGDEDYSRRALRARRERLEGSNGRRNR